MMNDPIVVWPPGTFFMDCSNFGSYFDCTYYFPDLQSQGAIACCPNW